MKMNKLYRLAALVFGASVLATGCIEETFPMSGSATAEQVEASTFAADGMVAASSTILVTDIVYNTHEDFGYPSIMIHLDHAIGEVFPSNGYSGGNQYYDRFQYYQYQFAIGPTGFCAFFWYHYYRFIKTANDLVAICGDRSEVAEQRGLAKTFRALFYLDMARLYDPLYAVSTERPSYMSELEKVQGLTVPLVDENITEEKSKNNPRLPREQMFQFIFNDLNDAEVCLADYTPTAKNIPSLAVVYGLKARAYLWLGGFEEGLYSEQYPDVLTGNAAYKKAAEYARLAIEASGCTPLSESEYCDKTNGFNTPNNAWMWAMLQSTDTIIATLYTWGSHMCCDASWGYGCGAQPGVRKATYERMHASDFRKKLIVGPNTSYDDYKDVTNLTKDEWKSFGLEGKGMRTYAHMKFRTNGGEKVNSSTGNVVDIPLMRVEEMYFIDAEATAHFDAAAGQKKLESFMTSFRAPKYKFPAGNDVVEEIIFQKRCELWGEGILFYDFKRLDMGIDNGYEGTNAPAGLDFATTSRCPAWNICIPVDEVQQNNALQGYNNPDPSDTLMPVSALK